MRKFFWGLISLSLLFSSCNKDELEALAFVIEGTVVDRKTENVIPGVAVEITTKGKTYSATTDENGFYSFEKLPLGSYNLMFSAEGYLNELVRIKSPEELATNGSSEEIVQNHYISLPPLTESALYTVYKHSYGKRIAAANIPYTVMFNEVGNPPITGSTDENGLLTLSNLPYGEHCTIYFDFTDNGMRYKSTSTFYTNEHQTNYISIYGYYKNGDFGLVSANIFNSNGKSVDDFNVSDNIEIKFTQPVDTANAYVRLGHYYEAIKTTWLEGNTKLSIDPSTDLNYNDDYYIELNIENLDNSQSFNDYLYFDTELKK